MYSLGLDYPKLKRLNRGVIMASITGFGQTGPYSSFKAPDIVSFAMGGLMNVNGPEKAAPVVAPCEQSYHSASVAAVFGILAALFMRLSSGKGQWIDTSAHEVTADLTGGVWSYSNTSQIARRAGSQFGIAPARIYPCLDGHVHILIIRPNHWLAFLEILGRPEALMGEEWRSVPFRNKNVEFIDAHIIEFTMAHTRMEIAELCQAKGVPCTPVNSPADFYEDPHIQGRGFFTQIEHPEIGPYYYPVPPYRLSGTPCRVERSAPLLGQHNREVYCKKLGYSADQLAAFKAAGTI
jgi:crotonobetainyl-CoA:carnitine CoA-transferase CaiB-like acyl-CoA transferase